MPFQLPHPFTDLDIAAAMSQRLVQLLSESPQYYPHLNMPPDAKSFDKVSTVVMPASGGGAAPSPGVETVVTTLVCPYGYDGIIQRISNNFSGPSFNPGVPSIVWRIRNGASIANSRFVENYDSIVVEYGTTNNPREIAGLFITSGQTYLYTVTNQDVAIPIDPSTTTTCCFAGYFWPQQRNTENL